MKINIKSLLSKAQSKRCRFASTTSSVGNESIEVPLTGKEDRLSSNTYQNVSMSSMAQPSDTSNILGGTRRSRSPGPKPTSHLMGNLNYNNSGNSPHHMIQNQDSARIVKSNQPYSNRERLCSPKFLSPPRFKTFRWPCHTMCRSKN